jgi:hypothetical protein
MAAFLLKNAWETKDKKYSIKENGVFLGEIQT